MIWIAGVCLVLGVLLIVLTPLLRSGAATPSAVKAFEKQKRELADALEALRAKKDRGELPDDEYAAERRALETEAASLMEAERQAARAAQPAPEKTTVRLLSGALALLITANIAAGIYLYRGGWRQFVEQPAMGEAAPQGGGGGGAPDPAAMVAKLEQRMKESPDDPAGWAMLGRSYLVLERFEDSVKAYQKASELDPANTDYQVGLGVATIRTGQVDKAEKIFSGILAKQPENPDALWFTGMLQVHKKDAAGAKKTWKKLLEVTPEEQKPEMQQQIDRMQSMLESAQ